MTGGWLGAGLGFNASRIVGASKAAPMPPIPVVASKAPRASGISVLATLDGGGACVMLYVVVGLSLVITSSSTGGT